MQYLKGNIDFQLQLLSVGIIASGVTLYKLIEKLQLNQQEIRYTQGAKIYAMKDFVKQLQRNSQPKIQTDKQQNQKRYLIKGVSNKTITTEQTETYSNQVFLGSPSTNPILEEYKLKKNSQSSSRSTVDNFLNAYNEELKLNISHSQASINDILFDGRILTDKIKASSKYISEDLDKKMYAFFLDQQLDFQVVQKNRFWYHCAYYLQTLLYFLLPDKFVKSCTAGNQRFQFFNGISFGKLKTQFNFLQDTYFLLKVRVKNGSIYSEIIADDKTMIIQHLKKQKSRNQLIFIGVSLIMAFFLVNFFSLVRRRFKRFFMKLQSKNYSYLNPKGIADDKLCHICYTNCRNTIFYGCRHALVCLSCYEHLSQQKCIVCNTFLDKTQIIVSEAAKRIKYQI